MIAGTVAVSSGVPVQWGTSVPYRHFVMIKSLVSCLSSLLVGQHAVTGGHYGIRVCVHTNTPAQASEIRGMHYMYRTWDAVTVIGHTEPNVQAGDKKDSGK